jgi:hypothetical protein
MPRSDPAHRAFFPGARRTALRRPSARGALLRVQVSGRSQMP